MGEGRRQPTPNPSPPGRGRQEKRVGSEEVGAKFCPLIFLPNYAPKIRSFLSVKS
ncbi:MULTISPECIES: hypothetical protein [unclassified Okeania]|uniref:hypothetical protein n=1 Tax=unclassified Okeania TaxID=2634635 RepID=UPI0013B84350|nr:MULTISPECIES: hypothetical protein [unclassified Okeania]NET23380.1 hypothetical protein [Okeania sp. SIO1H5]NET96521.1 hypothetical protein [Okeania sp. SIO1H2]